MGRHRLVIALAGMNAALLITVWAQAYRVSAADVPETLRAKTIELVDGQGRVRAQLKVEADGEAVFRLRDPRGEIRVKLGAGKAGSGLLLLNGSTEPGIQMLSEDDGATITLTNKDGKRRLLTP